jgi:integrase
MSVVTPGSSHDPVTRRLPPGVDRLPSGGFRARVTVNGRQRSLGTFPNATAAGRAAEKARADLGQGFWLDPRRSAVTLDAWIGEWMPTRPVRPYTLAKDLERYGKHIKPWLGPLPLVKITPYQVQKWLTALAQVANPPTVKKAHTLLQTALGVRGAIGDQRLAVNPCVIVRPPTYSSVEWQLLTSPQIDLLLEHTTERWRPLLIVLADTGVRWSEMAALTRADYNPLRRELLIRRSLDRQGQVQPTKNRRNRAVPLPGRAVTTLNLLAEGLDTDQRLFTAPRGGPLAPSNFTNRVWKPACEKTGVTARIHDLRHSYASRMLAGGATLAEVRDLLGHSSITVTEKYLHIDRGSLADTVLRALG